MPINKLQNLPIINLPPLWMPSFKKIGNHCLPQDTIVYNLRMLQAIDASELALKLFQSEDFVIPPQSQDRSPVITKVGKLYIEYCPGGKSSFTLTIKLIDKETRTLRSFLNLQNPRYPRIQFENLVPFSLDSFYFGRTIVGRPDRASPQVQESLSYAYELKLILTKLMLDQDITEEEQQRFRASYLALYSPNSQNIRENTEELKRDIQHFGQNPNDKPRSLFEVSAKIGAIALSKLSLKEEEIIEVLSEYRQSANQDVNFNASIQSIIIDTLLDNNRFPLKSIISDISVLLENAVNSLPTSIIADSEHIEILDDNTLNSNTYNSPKEFDMFLRNQLSATLDLKTRKSEYVELLNTHINELSPRLKKEFALYLLNEPEHFLKKERHFFRLNDYSNQTFSMHQVVAALLQGKDKPALINDTVKIEEHELSRHTQQCFS